MMTKCYTNSVGRRQIGRNYLCLSKNGLTKRIILHELGHIIGLYHEHQRPDRDEYVKINTENIKTGKDTFKKMISENFITLSEKYDFNSIKHYSMNKFAHDRSKNTITPLKTEDIEITKIGRYEQLSDIDISGVNRLYNCSECTKLIEADSGVFDVVKDLNSSTSITKHCEWRILGAPGEQVIFHISS
ncbi:GSCOCG00005409001-RA-CDS [Cotesia congregata]|nr:GSCOCG00005409001-RA-CDS [Cotesia congregata]